MVADIKQAKYSCSELDMIEMRVEKGSRKQDKLEESVAADGNRRKWWYHCPNNLRGSYRRIRVEAVHKFSIGIIVEGGLHGSSKKYYTVMQSLL